jgi:hypothetical protein
MQPITPALQLGHREELGGVPVDRGKGVQVARGKPVAVTLAAPAERVLGEQADDHRQIGFSRAAECRHRGCRRQFG